MSTINSDFSVQKHKHKDNAVNGGLLTKIANDEILVKIARLIKEKSITLKEYKKLISTCPENLKKYFTLKNFSRSISHTSNSMNMIDRDDFLRYAPYCAYTYIH